jgi:hypothetical protein
MNPIATAATTAEKLNNSTALMATRLVAMSNREPRDGELTALAADLLRITEQTGAVMAQLQPVLDPCTTCNGSGRVSAHENHEPGMVDLHSWQDCPECQRQDAEGPEWNRDEVPY